MNSVVVFDSRSGNTKRVAAAIAEALGASGSVEMVAAIDASATVSFHHDLVVVGGPTEGRHATPAIEAFFDRLPAHALRGIAAAAFDTRSRLASTSLGLSGVRHPGLDAKPGG